MGSTWARRKHGSATPFRFWLHKIHTFCTSINPQLLIFNSSFLIILSPLSARNLKTRLMAGFFVFRLVKLAWVEAENQKKAPLCGCFQISWTSPLMDVRSKSPPLRWKGLLIINIKSPFFIIGWKPLPIGDLAKNQIYFCSSKCVILS